VIRGWFLPIVRVASLALFIVAFYGLLHFSIYSLLGPAILDSPFGPTSILMILVAAPGVPLLRYWISERMGNHRRYLMVRWGLMLLYLVVGVPVALGIIEYSGPYNLLAIAMGAALSLAFFVFAVAVALPLYLYSSGVIRARSGLVHAGSFLAILAFPLTTLRLFLAGSKDFDTFLQAWGILAALLLAWDWGDISAKLARTLRDLGPRTVRNPYEVGLATYLPAGLLWLSLCAVLTLLIRDWLVERTILGGPTSYLHVFFWIIMLLVGVLALGFLFRYQRPLADPKPFTIER
jgi:hypothetical protein